MYPGAFLVHKHSKENAVQCRLRECLFWSLLLIVLLVPGSALAIPITLTVDAPGASRYLYSYTVANDGSLGAGVAVELFDILFPATLYDEHSLTIVTPAALRNDWDEQIFPPVLGGVPAAYDVMARRGGIPVGGS